MQKQNHLSPLTGGFAAFSVLLSSFAPNSAHAEGGDAYAMYFSAQVAAPRPVLTANPAAYLFGDVGFADSSQPVSRTSSKPAASRKTTTRTTSHTESVAEQATYSGKSSKEVVPTLREEAQVSGPSFAVVGGWDSRYVYHGEDWVQKGVRGDTSGIWFARATMEWNGFAAYAGYLQTTDKVLPRDIRSDSQYASEVQVGASYTLAIIPDVLDTTLGYNAYFLSSEDFVGHSYLGEAFARIAYKQIPFLTPSITAYYLNGDSGSSVLQSRGPTTFDVEGWVYEARLDGNVKLCNLGSEGSIGLNPFVTLVVDGQFWQGGDDFQARSMEYGLNVPIQLNKRLSLNLHVNFLQSLIDRNFPVKQIKQPDFWGGASVAYKF